MPKLTRQAMPRHKPKPAKQRVKYTQGMIWDLANDECRYIADTAICCGAQVHEAKPYCKTHAELCVRVKVLS